MANGRVITGFSLPKVAKYTASGTTVTYSNLMALARGVSVSMTADQADSNDFFADNVRAETSAGTFGSGTLDLTVDGLKDAAAALIEGTPTPDAVTVGTETVDVTSYGEAQAAPYVGIGFIIRYLEDGVTSYVPVVLTKCKFQPRGLSAETAEDTINYQTESLTADLFRDDTAARNWKRVGEAQTTETAAENVITVLLGGTIAGGGGAGGSDPEDDPEEG